MKNLGNVFVAIIIAIGIFAFTCFSIVPLDKVGVRSSQLGKGVEERDLGPGLWMIIPGVHKLTIMDPTLQSLEYSPNSEHQALSLRTKDQYTTKLDVSIFYRIKKGKAWDVLLKMGPGYAFKERFRQQAEASIWKVMGNMRTEDFYDSNARSARALETINMLNESLKEYLFDLGNASIKELDAEKIPEEMISKFKKRQMVIKEAVVTILDKNSRWVVKTKSGIEYTIKKTVLEEGDKASTAKPYVKVYSQVNIEAENLLIRRVVFDKRFEDKLIQKQLLGQQRLLAESQTAREEEQQTTQMIQKETDAKVRAIRENMNKEIMELKATTFKVIEQIKADAKLKVRELMADAQRYEREKIAEGDKLREIARAIGEKAVNEAYQGPGGKLLLSRKMIENITIGRIQINTNKTNPFDVNQFLQMVGALTEDIEVENK